MIPLEDLGNRICIIGPSSTGKSTLAQNLGNELNLPVCHLDQMAHIPYSNWKTKEKSEFQIEHQTFLKENQSWIIEGNYSFLMPERFAQATAIIWLDFHPWSSLVRYLKRCIAHSNSRPGNLEGAQNQFSWDMIRFMLFKAPKNRPLYTKLIEESGKLSIRISNFQALKAYYKFWNLP